jgi:hypothetical protein
MQHKRAQDFAAAFPEIPVLCIIGFGQQLQGNGGRIFDQPAPEAFIGGSIDQTLERVEAMPRKAVQTPRVQHNDFLAEGLGAVCGRNGCKARLWDR